MEHLRQDTTSALALQEESLAELARLNATLEKLNPALETEQQDLAFFFTHHSRRIRTLKADISDVFARTR
jgi:hypothetical protein